MTTNKKDNLNDDVVVEAKELDSVFNFDKEEACYAGQFADLDGQLPYRRMIPITQKTWDDFRAKCIDVNSGKWYKSGNQTGIIKPDGEVPKRIINSIVRIKAKNGLEYLLSHGRIIAYNQFGDPCYFSVDTPEKFIETKFKWSTVPNRETGYASRVNTGPDGSGTLIYTLPFTKEAAENLFSMRQNDSIQLLVKIQDQSNTYLVQKPNATLQENFDMFTTESFNYLFFANYLTAEEKLFNMKKAESAGLIEKMDDSERNAVIKQQEALNQKDKMSSYR